MVSRGLRRALPGLGFRASLFHDGKHQARNNEQPKSQHPLHHIFAFVQGHNRSKRHQPAKCDTQSEFTSVYLFSRFIQSQVMGVTSHLFRWRQSPVDSPRSLAGHRSHQGLVWASLHRKVSSPIGPKPYKPYRNPKPCCLCACFL